MVKNSKAASTRFLALSTLSLPSSHGLRAQRRRQDPERARGAAEKKFGAYRLSVATPKGSLPPQRKVCHQTTEKRHHSDIFLPRITCKHRPCVSKTATVPRSAGSQRRGERAPRQRCST